MAAIALWAEQAIPEDARTPLHWGLTGEADRFGDKAETIAALWTFAGIGVLVSGLLALAPALDPRAANLRRRPVPYLVGWVATLAILVLCSALIAALGAGIAPENLSPARMIIGAISLLLLVLGNFLGKVRPNFVLGVRTPWTLSSDIAWEKTHRLAGWLFVLTGLAGIAASILAPPKVMMGVFVLAVLMCAFGSIAASYLYWRSAPDKRGPSELA